MKAPIAQRRVTGARRIQRRRGPRGAPAPLHRPLALLYRRSGMAGTNAPAAVRAADGRPVPLAPRLQLALNLSFALTEQHRTFQVSAAPYDAAPVMLRASAERKSSTIRRSNFAAPLIRVESYYRAPAGARSGPPPSFGHTGASVNAAHASRHHGLVYASLGPRPIAPSGRSGRGDEPGGPAMEAGVAPPWPPSQGPGATGAESTARHLSGADRLLVARLGNPPAVVGHSGAELALRLIERRTQLTGAGAGRLVAWARPGAAARHTPSDPMPDRNILAAGGQGAGERVDAAAVGSRDSPPQERIVKGSSDVPPRERRGASRPVADVRLRIPASPADRHGERPPARAERRSGTDGTARRPGAAAQTAHAHQKPGRLSSPLVPRRLPGVMAFASVPRPGRAGATLAADRPRTVSSPPAARGIPAPLYLAERQSARTTAPASFSAAWTPPSLDFRNAAPPSALPLLAEARPAPAAVPSAAPVDLEAVSRNVISRIEKRLRIERERRGRS